ncbi:membrane-associated kinase regulator 5 [Humulus lupulus]|uniref:membrane-associated kinase regulator 5 n=1 Tax=Humulus lupulus TaxID=3486 RepID=UPI002B40C124|nr:membrane-associated kinase regulator 5 [Humulus lupulus]
MEALNFLKFWKPTTTFTTPVLEVDNEVDEEEEEDSFFDLELTAPDFDNKKKNPDEKSTVETKRVDLDEERGTQPAKTLSGRELCYPKPSLALSPIDSISKRKVLPLGPITSKPQSPIALLKSAPTFRVFMFKKSKSRGTEKKIETESLGSHYKHQKQEGKLFAVRFNVEEASNVSKLSRDNSSRRASSSSSSSSTKRQDQSSDDTKTEQRFSKDVIQKYLKLVKPLYVKVSKRYNGKANPSPADFFMSSPASSPATMASMASPKDRPGNLPAGIRTVCKHLGKSKSSSSSAAIGAQPPVNRRDDSLLQQHDGIQSAILHCKRSFNSSRDSFSLSRSTSDSSSMKSCSSDSYRLSNSASETSHDFSARSSIEDGRCLNI